MAKPIYSTSVVIDSFKGLNQLGDGANMNMRYAVEMENVNVHNGSFSPMREGIVLEQELGRPIGTLAYLSRRYIDNPDTLLVAISNGRVFTKELDGDDNWVQRYPLLLNTAGEDEDPVYVEDGDPLTESDCDWLTYEANDFPYYLNTKTYVKGERCKYKEIFQPLPEVMTGVDLYVRRIPGQDDEWIPGNWEEYGINSYNDDGHKHNFVPFYSTERKFAYNTRCARDVTAPGDEQKTYKIYRTRYSSVPQGEWNSTYWTLEYTMHPFSTDRYYGKNVIAGLLEHYDAQEDDRVAELLTYECKTDITTPEDFDSTKWDVVTVGDPVDVLLFTNATDGMFCLYGDTMAVHPIPITTDWENKPSERIKFDVIARYNERIWGSGIKGDPDKLMYSASFNPYDWTLNDEYPEDGAGDILQPTWDGDSFLALKQFGSDLLAFKRNSVWRIYGTHPGEFVMTRQYGGGTIQENTVAVQDQYMYMLGEHGLMRYDGVGAYAFLQDVIQKLMHDVVNHDGLDKACAAMRNGIYCLALPIHGSEFCNAILEYNPMESTFALRTNISVDSFLQYDERLFYTSATEPGKVFELTDEVGHPLPCTWISGYQDLEQKNSIKSAFILYMMVDCEAPVELRVGIRTEKKFKEKVISTKPNKMTRLHLNTQGRQFRLEIKSYSGVPFTIAGGIKLDLELDPD